MSKQIIVRCFKQPYSLTTTPNLTSSGFGGMNKKLTITPNKYADAILIGINQFHNGRLQTGVVQELNNDEIKELIGVLSEYVDKYPVTNENKRTSDKGCLVSKI